MLPAFRSRLHRVARGDALLLALGLPLLLYAGLVGLLAAKQESLLFFPEPLPADYRPMQPGVEEVWIPVDGATLHGLHFRQAGARGLLFFLHGNAGNADQWLGSTSFYREVGFDVFVLDYRGYGRSSGSIGGEAQLHADVRSAWDRVASGYAGARRVIFGRSIGAGPAARLAADVEADLLVLVSPFSSLRRLAAEKYPWVPSWLLRYPLPVEEWIAHARMPIVLIHGEQDDLIGIEHSERLAAVRVDAELLRLPGLGHNDLQRTPLYLQTLARRLDALASHDDVGPAPRR